MEMRTRKALPPSPHPLWQRATVLNQRYSIFAGEGMPTRLHRALHEKEVRLLALLPDACSPFPRDNGGLRGVGSDRPWTMAVEELPGGGE